MSQMVEGPWFRHRWFWAFDVSMGQIQYNLSLQRKSLDPAKLVLQIGANNTMYMYLPWISNTHLGMP